MKRFCCLLLACVLLPCFASAECLITLENGYAPASVLIEDDELCAFLTQALASGTPADDAPDLTSYLFDRYTVGGNMTVYVDDLYERAYAVANGQTLALPFQAGMLLQRLLFNEGTMEPVAENRAALFAAHGWTLLWSIASFDVALPDSLAFSSADENASYFTFHQLLLNDAGYNLTPYLGETVTVHIDAVYEGVNRVTWMPSDEALLVDGLGVTIAMRAITLELNEEIIGAYLSAGRHSTEFALSLQGSSPASLLNVVSLNEWLVRHSALTDAEQALASMSAEDVLRFYCNATTADEQCACLARTALLEALSRNLPNNELSMPFVPSFSPVGGVQSIEAMADGVYAVTLASGDVFYPQMALEDGAWRIMSFFNTGY